MRYIPAALFFLFIGWITFEANLDQYNTFIRWGREIPNGDKIGHFLVYGVMALLLNISLRFSKIRIGKMRIYTAAAAVFTFALAEEFTQLAFDSRTFDFRDIASNTFGIVVFSFLSQYVPYVFSLFKKPVTDTGSS